MNPAGPRPTTRTLRPVASFGYGRAKFRGVPPRQEAVDLEPEGQLQDVLEGPGLDLRDVDGLLLLVDAGLHAVVADPVAGRRAHRVVDGHDGQGGDGVAVALEGVHLGDLLFERAARQRHAERAELERPGLLAEPGRAAILVLVVALDAVPGLVERPRQVGAGVGEVEPLAMPAVLGMPQELRGAGDLARDVRDQVIDVDLLGDLEDDPVAVLLPPLRRQDRPRRVVGGELELRGVVGLGLHPLRDVRGVGHLREWGEEKHLQLVRQDRPIDRERFFGLPPVGLADDELALDRVQRGQLRMPGLQGGEFLLDPEQLPDEVLDVRRQLDDQLRLLFRHQARRVASGRLEPGVEVRRAPEELVEEGGVQAEQAVPPVEVAEREAEGQRLLKAEFHGVRSIIAEGGRFAGREASGRSLRERSTPRTCRRDRPC